MITFEQFIVKYKYIGDYAYSSNETKYNSFTMGKYINDNHVIGDVVECGLAAGSNFAFMILGTQQSANKIDRKFWGFDSFQGIQLAGKKDSVQPGIGAIGHNVDVADDELLVSSGITSVSKKTVIDNLTKWNLYDNVKLIEGWIQRTLPDNMPVQIAMLRLDMDIYAPTKFALERLYPLITSGGVVIIDDWALLGARTACNDYFDSIGFKPDYQTIANSEPVYFIKP